MWPYSSIATLVEHEGKIDFYKSAKKRTQLEMAESTRRHEWDIARHKETTGQLLSQTRASYGQAGVKMALSAVDVTEEIDRIADRDREEMNKRHYFAQTMYRMRIQDIKRAIQQQRTAMAIELTGQTIGGIGSGLGGGV